MKAIVQHRYGGPETLEVEDLPRPEVDPDGILIRVRAAGLNPRDYFTMSGLPVLRPMSGLRRPKEPRQGTDFAGVVEAVGENVTRFQPGDPVYGARTGCFAEYVRCSEQSVIAPKPDRLTFEQAAAMPIPGLTALQGLRDVAHVRPGHSVAVTGAAGGIGSVAVQIAKALGAEVTGVCRTQNVDLVRSLGADHVVDYTQEDFTRGGRRYDVILDNGGGNSLRSLLGALAPGGVLVPNCGHNLRLMAAGYVARYVLRRPVREFLSRLKAENLLELNRFVDAGELTPLVDRSYSLTETREAVAYLMQRHPRGKVVLTV